MAEAVPGAALMACPDGTKTVVAQPEVRLDGIRPGEPLSERLWMILYCQQTRYTKQP
jgi:hypothetical protein